MIQKIQEGKMWEEIEREKAKERQALNGTKNLGLNVDTSPTLEKKVKQEI